MSELAAQSDIFARARSVAAALLVVAGLTGIIGSFMDWVTITPPPPVAPGADFGDTPVEEAKASKPFSGIEAGDGWIVVGASAVLILSGSLLVSTRRKRWAMLAFVASLVVGSVAVADYRGIGDLSSSISHRMDIVGAAAPALGITLTAAAGFAGLIGAVLAIVATPSRAS